MKKCIVAIIAVLTIAVTAAMCIGCTPLFRTDVDYKVGVSQFVEHGALDQATEGFKSELTALMQEAGKTVDIVVRNAQNDTSNCTTIANTFVTNKADLVLGVATPAAKALAAATKDIPVLFTAVTDAVSEKMVASNERPGGNVTGASDINPVAKQIELLVRLVKGQPGYSADKKVKVGFLYATSEKNSIVQLNLAKAKCEELGVELEEGGVNDANEIAGGMAKLQSCDGIYIPTDNIIAKSIQNVASINEGESYRKIIVCGEDVPNQVAGIATYGINYNMLGKMAAKMAFDILVNGKNPAEMPVQSITECPLTVNAAVAEKLRITIPQEVMDEYNAQQA